MLLLCASAVGGDKLCVGVSSGSRGKALTYLSGDALTDAHDCVGPQGQRYPHEEVARYVRSVGGSGSSRAGRAMNFGEFQNFFEITLHNIKLGILFGRIYPSQPVV